MLLVSSKIGDTDGTDIKEKEMKKFGRKRQKEIRRRGKKGCKHKQ